MPSRGLRRERTHVRPDWEGTLTGTATLGVLTDLRADPAEATGDLLACVRHALSTGDVPVDAEGTGSVSLRAVRGVEGGEARPWVAANAEVVLRAGALAVTATDVRRPAPRSAPDVAASSTTLADGWPPTRLEALARSFARAIHANPCGARVGDEWGITVANGQATVATTTRPSDGPRPNEDQLERALSMLPVARGLPDTRLTAEVVALDPPDCHVWEVVASDR